MSFITESCATKIFNPINPNTRNNVLFYRLIKYWILHIACISPISWMKMFVLFKFHNYTKLNLVGGEQSWMEIRCLQHPSTLPTAFFKLNLALKMVVAFFSEINLVHLKILKITKIWKNMGLKFENSKN